MTMKTFIASAALGAALLAANAANATELSYSFTNSDMGPSDLESATFTLSSTPTPDATNPQYDAFTIDNVPATINGVSGESTVMFYGPFSEGLAYPKEYPTGAIAITIDTASLNAGFFYLPSSVLFSGTISSPTLNAGTFTLTGDSYGGTGTLTVSAVSAAPEPSTWLLMIAGVGVVGSMLRRRKIRPLAIPTTASA